MNPSQLPPKLVTLTATSKPIKAYYSRLEAIAAQNVHHESATREAFKGLLEETGKQRGWTLITELSVDSVTKQRNVPDGTLRDALQYPRGYWEAKDTNDNLEQEIAKKIARGYPLANIIFEDTRRAVLYQDEARVAEHNLQEAADVAVLLNRFLNYTRPTITRFEDAVEAFREQTPQLAEGLLKLIKEAHRSNKKFQAAYADFYALAQHALNPNLSKSAVDEMLIQHMLTERLMRTVFDNADFARRNAIAVEVEKVIAALTSKSFSRDTFLGQLDYFYEAIEAAARELSDFSARQTFINSVYERFFQGYAVKVADTHGIVYTPQPIVDFMCAAVQETLADEFGYTLDHPDVCIIDPCTGTGNFIVNLLRRAHEANPAALRDLYKNRLFANEVMLLPYYVASLNIEHTYYELTQEYAPFEGLCYVDTLDLAEGGQMSMNFMTEANTARVQRQKAAKITVIVGNPPYNANQQNENDNNKNRKYPVVDGRVRETYAKDSKATLKAKLYDPYVKFFRWAADRLEGRDGIVCYVSNNSFVSKDVFDGMRKHLLQDFTRVYHLDLHGDVRQNPKLSGTTHNVFGIQVGVGITVAVRSSTHTDHQLFYYRAPEMARKEEKLEFLKQNIQEDGRYNALNTIAWTQLTPDTKNRWLVPENADQFEAFVPIGSKTAKAAKHQNIETIFKTFSLGVNTARDEVAYDFDKDQLVKKITEFVEDYNSEVDRYKRANPTKDKSVDDFVKYDSIKWSENLKINFVRGKYAEYSPNKIRASQYRPFTKRYLFFDSVLNDRMLLQPRFFPTTASERENQVICVSAVGNNKAFHCLAVNTIPDLHLTGDSQTFPFYVYSEDGAHRRENITDWALTHFQTHYNDSTLSKWDIFHYVYAVLHHPHYRQRYADNLKRDLPRIPLLGTASDFKALVGHGRALADLHINYESVTPYKLEHQWAKGKPAVYTVEKMRLSRDKTSLTVNPSLTLSGIPVQAFAYRLGSRSALDWVIEQYQVKKSKDGDTILSDPNQYSDDERYIVDLVGRVVAVSVKTVEIVDQIEAVAL